MRPNLVTMLVQKITEKGSLFRAQAMSALTAIRGSKSSEKSKKCSFIRCLRPLTFHIHLVPCIWLTTIEWLI